MRDEVRSQPHIADGARHPRVIWAVSESEGASQKPFDGDPYTRLARTRCWSRESYGAWMCWFQGARHAIGDVTLLRLQAERDRSLSAAGSLRIVAGDASRNRVYPISAALGAQVG